MPESIFILILAVNMKCKWYPLAHLPVIINLNNNSVIRTTVGRYIRTEISRLPYMSEVYKWDYDGESKVVVEDCKKIPVLNYVLFFLIIALVGEANLTFSTSLLYFV